MSKRRSRRCIEWRRACERSGEPARSPTIPAPVMASPSVPIPGTRSMPRRRASRKRGGFWTRTCERTSMLEEPTSLRIEDPGVRALFTEHARFQSWLDVEAALAQAQAELGIIPAAAAKEIISKAHLKYLDLAAVRSGLAKTGHPLVPLVWELDRACEGDAGGYVHWGATTQNITQTGQLLQVRRAHEIFLGQLAAVLTHLAG